MVDSPLTDEEFGLLYRHGTRGFIYNAERVAQKEVIKEWSSNDRKRKRLHSFNEIFDMTHVLLDTSRSIKKTAPLQPGLEFNESMFTAGQRSPFDAPHPQLKQIGDELAGNVLERFKQELTRLLENSTLSKRQFVVFVLLWEEPNEYGTERQLGERGVADALDLAVGTVRSHHARAKNKIEEAEFTAGLTDYAVTDWDTAHEKTMQLIDEHL